MGRDWKIAIFAVSAAVLLTAATIFFLINREMRTQTRPPTDKDNISEATGKTSAASKSSREKFRSPSVGASKTTSDTSSPEFPAANFSSMEESDKINKLANMTELDAEIISAALIDGSEDVRVAAFNSLSSFAEEGKDITKYLERGFKDESEDVRDAACTTMENISDRRSKFNLMDMASDSPYADTRTSAVKCLISSGASTDEARKLMLKTLADKDATVRAWALSTADYIWNRNFVSEQDAIGHIQSPPR